MIRFIFFTLVCLSGFALILGISSSSGYKGYKIYDLTTSNQTQNNNLFKLSSQDEYDFLSLPRLVGLPVQVMVTPEKQQEFLEFLDVNHISYKVINEEVASTIEELFNNTNLQKRNSPRLSTERYYSYREIIEYMDYLTRKYPAKVYVRSVGMSYERRPLKTIRITNGDGKPDKKVIFIDGGFHAREWISPAAVLYVMDQLTENYEVNKDLLRDYDWIIMPVVNPDGYEYTQSSVLNRMWRKTRTPHRNLFGRVCYGVDPNRNFDFHWMETGASANPCSDTYGGPAPFSEPETRVLRDVMYTIRNRCKFYLTVHSYGQYLLHPWGWTSNLPKDWKELDTVARAGYNAIRSATGSVYTVGSSTNVLYAAAGGSDDYAYGVTGIPISITMELPSGGYTGFDPPPSSIHRHVDETWIGIKAMATVVINKY